MLDISCHKLPPDVDDILKGYQKAEQLAVIFVNDSNNAEITWAEAVRKHYPPGSIKVVRLSSNQDFSLFSDVAKKVLQDLALQGVVFILINAGQAALDAVCTQDIIQPPAITEQIQSTAPQNSFDVNIVKPDGTACHAVWPLDAAKDISYHIIDQCTGVRAGASN